MDVRAAEEAEIDHLARVWFDGWRDAHEQIVPVELTRLRTLESFGTRLRSDLQHIRVVGPFGAPVGFCIVKGDELYQLFVSAPSRGSGVAAALIEDAEARLSEGGRQDCLVGLRDRKRAGGEILRETRLVSGRDDGQSVGDRERLVSAGSVALRKVADALSRSA
jgi:GNAT superfamily N-acetyltransferase